MEFELKQGMPTDDELIHLAGEISKCWRKLGQKLCLIARQLDQIELATGISRKSYAMLKKWMESGGSEATYRKLAKALNSINRSDLCMKYCAAKHGSKFVRCVRAKQLCFLFFFVRLFVCLFVCFLPCFHSLFLKIF